METEGREELRGSETYDERMMAPIASEVWLKVLDRSTFPEVFRHFLLGEVPIYVEDENTGEKKVVWRKGKEALVNEMGCDFIIGYMFGASSIDKIATRIDENEVNTMCSEMRNSIIDIITERHKEFEIRSTNWSYILSFLDHYYFMNLSGARKGTILDAMTPTLKRIETIRPVKEEGRGIMRLR